MQGYFIFFSPENILINVLMVFLGVTTGIIAGALPGIGQTMTLALFLPFTFKLTPIAAFAFLIGIYKGANYGGSISAILINTPGTAAASCTLLDGYPLSKAGKTLKALKMAKYASVLADVSSDMVLLFLAAPVASLAIKFGPPELFGVLILGLTVIGSVSGDSILKGLISGLMGLLLSTIGMDPITGELRYTFGYMELHRGITFIPMLIGLYALSQIFAEGEGKIEERKGAVSLKKSSNPDDNRVTGKEFKAVIPAIYRSTVIGSIIGMIPGTGAATSAFVCYGEGKRRSKNPELYGKGSLEGIAAAEAGNNAVVGPTMVPLLSLGIPGDPACAVLLGALMIHGLTPGPLLFAEQGPTVYAILAGLIFANVANMVVATGGLKYIAKIAQVRKSMLFPIVFVICVIGAYSFNSSIFDIATMVGFGFVGYFMRKFGFPLAPINIAFLLGHSAEIELRNSIIMGDGSPAIFLKRPITLVLFGITLLSVLAIVARTPKGKQFKDRLLRTIKRERAMDER